MSEDERRRGPSRVGDLLPEAARQLGLEAQLAQAVAISAWERIVREQVPAAAGACRLRSIERGIAVVEADAPIVAQELRLRSVELAALMRAAVGASVVEVRILVRHV